MQRVGLKILVNFVSNLKAYVGWSPYELREERTKGMLEGVTLLLNAAGRCFWLMKHPARYSYMTSKRPRTWMQAMRYATCHQSSYIGRTESHTKKAFQKPFCTTNRALEEPVPPKRAINTTKAPGLIDQSQNPNESA